MSTSHLAESGPPAKRCREDSEPSEPNIRKSDLLYFENGNIVLLSLPQENTITAFKVFKDFLLLYSPAFEGMLSMPSPQNQETYDGVPLVRLYDEATELNPFLSAVYDPTEMPSKRDVYFSHEKVASVLKLSKKYQFNKLHTSMKNTLLEIWPSSLEEWDRIRETSEEIDLDLFNSVLPEPCSAIRLGRDYDLPEILPATFYHLLCTLPEAFSDTEPEDGNHWGLWNAPFGAHSDFSLLSLRDFMCFVRGSYAVRQFLVNTTEDFIAKLEVGGASDPDKCGTCRCDLQAFFKRHWKDPALDSGDVLEALNYSTIFLPESLCRDCRVRCRSFEQESRQVFWTGLPSFFDL